MKKIRFPLVKPYIARNEITRVEKVLISGWLTQGEQVSILEEKIKKYNEVKYAFLLNSATSGLIAAVKSLNLSGREEVIVPSFTFPATVNSIILGGARPVFCDIDLRTFNILPSQIETLINGNTKAIMPVHEFGLSADMEKIVKIAKKYGLFVIEDAACSLGSEYCGKKTGTIGDIGIFSFHPRKIITSGEGGCVITNSPRIAKNIECLRNHGERDKKFINFGYNFRLSDIQAAVLFSQFEKIERIIKERIRLALNYNKLLGSLENRELLKTPFRSQNCRHTYQSYVIILSRKINRDKLKNILRQAGTETQFGTYCVPLLDFFKKNFDIPRNRYSNAYHAFKHTLALPLYHALQFREQEFIVRQLTKAIKKCAE